MTDGSRAIVYVVDDDCDLGASLARLLNRSGFAAEPFVDPAQLLAAYTAAPAACILTDVMMGDSTALPSPIACARSIRRRP
jgi:two-component system, LuxR family, response regulator FixJ